MLGTSSSLGPKRSLQSACEIGRITVKIKCHWYKHLDAIENLLLCDLDHIDATIPLFNPDANLKHHAFNREHIRHV